MCLNLQACKIDHQSILTRPMTFKKKNSFPEFKPKIGKETENMLLIKCQLYKLNIKTKKNMM